MNLMRHTSRRLYEEHIAVLALLERFGQALARLAAPPAANDPVWSLLLPQFATALELEEKQLFPRLHAPRASITTSNSR